MTSEKGTQDGRALRDHGLTLVELIVVVSIVLILATAAYPVARFQVRRARERELRADLQTMRSAIDRYKDAANKGAIEIKEDTYGYPPDLQTLVDGVDVEDNHVKFLRAIPVDPMTGNTDWKLRAMQDEPDSSAWGGQNVFDVHSSSEKVGSDGRKYSEW
jgi:general secretion pathway protein G